MIRMIANYIRTVFFRYVVFVVFLISQRKVYADSGKARMGKSELYLNIRDELSIPGLTQKICCTFCTFHFSRKSAQGLCRFRKDPDGEGCAVFEHTR